MKSRRALDAATARRMVAIREARRAARRVHRAAIESRLVGTPADTTAAAQAIQDALLRRISPAEKLAQVARLSRMVDQLSVEGLRQRDPTVDERVLRYRRAELRLGRELAARVYDAPHDA
jgi:hypothetical protein